MLFAKFMDFSCISQSVPSWSVNVIRWLSGILEKNHNDLSRQLWFIVLSEYNGCQTILRTFIKSVHTYRTRSNALPQSAFNRSAYWLSGLWQANATRTTWHSSFFVFLLYRAALSGSENKGASPQLRWPWTATIDCWASLDPWVSATHLRTCKDLTNTGWWCILSLLITSSDLVWLNSRSACLSGLRCRVGRRRPRQLNSAL